MATMRAKAFKQVAGFSTFITSFQAGLRQGLKDKVEEFNVTQKPGEKLVIPAGKHFHTIHGPELFKDVTKVHNVVLDVLNACNGMSVLHACTWLLVLGMMIPSEQRVKGNVLMRMGKCARLLLLSPHTLVWLWALR